MYYNQKKQHPNSIAGLYALALAVLLLTSIATPDANAQSGHLTVTGTIVDESGLPVVGAAVMVKGQPSMGGAVTDEKGSFSIRIPDGSVLIVSCIGYVSREKKIEKDLDWFVTLEEDSQIIEDAVVVGYGVQKKESVVGAISQVSSDAIVNSGTTNITNSLAGKLSGVQTFQTSGQPGSNDARIFIRGLSSWNGSSPLVMVDGIERSFNDLDPNEVKTISVLKDASATAVFGAKGANGVILVTTKTGSKGAPKMKLSVEYGASTPTFLPKHVASADIMEMANVAFKNEQSFGSLYSDSIISAYRNRTNSLRYPDTDWYDLMLKNFASSVNANFQITGGTDKVKYFVSAGYTHEGSIVKQQHFSDDTRFSYDKINFRSNLDFNLTSSTLLSLKAGGSIGITQRPSNVSVSTLFSTMYNASYAMFPAYYPDWALELYPDTDYPDDSGSRVGGNQGAYYSNPYMYLAAGDFEQSTLNKINTDLVFSQKLDFITKGLEINAKAALTTSFTRISLKGSQSIPRYDLDWTVADTGTGNPWTSTSKSNDIFVQDPYLVQQDNSVRSSAIIFYWEASLNYNRKFANAHNVSAMVLMNQRQYLTVSSTLASFPSRSQAFVARATYDYKGKYLIEANMGYTGSEQFAPANRYGFFPSVAAGYVLSNEKFWKNAMPWWSKFKLRYSDGLVGSDSASQNWLYYSNYVIDGNYIAESSAANSTARWETARKRDLGIELGWLDNDLTLNIDLFDEKRKDMLIPPVVTPLVAVGYKDINAGAMKKHGIDIELKYRHTTARGLYYEVGAMVGLNENRITNYEDAPYIPEYQKYAGKPYSSKRESMTSIDNGYFNTIDEIHGYPVYTNSWLSVYPGQYKMLDYNADGNINSDDLHVIAGSAYPPCIYSFNVGLAYKGFSFNMLFYGNQGKWIRYEGSYEKEFIKKDLTVHTAQLDYWRPDNRNASHSTLSMDDVMYTWAGGSATDGYTLGLAGHTWRKADYLTLKEVYLAYKFDGTKIRKALGVQGLSVTLTGNNLWTFTNLIEGNPQATSAKETSYPIMRIVKLGVKLDF